MKIVEVTDEKTATDFLELPTTIYAGDPNFIRPLDNDINKVFDRSRNKFFNHGTCSRWMLYNNRGTAIGRVAAFINEANAYTFDQPTGGMGFFECINDQDAANLLFDTCKAWLQERGMEAMDGPINFG